MKGTPGSPAHYDAVIVGEEMDCETYAAMSSAGGGRGVKPAPGGPSGPWMRSRRKVRQSLEAPDLLTGDIRDFFRTLGH